VKNGSFLWGGKQPWGLRTIIRSSTLLAALLAGAQAHAQQGPTGPFYDKIGQLEPMLGAVEEPCKGPRLIAASDPLSFLYKESEGSSTRVELRMRGTMGLCMRNFVASVYGQYSDVKRGSKLVPGYGPDGSQLGPWWESRDMYVAAQVGGRAILPSRGDLLHHEILFLARGQVYEERDFKAGCELGQCPWFASVMPLYRLGLGVLRLNVGGSVDYGQFVTDWFERNPSHSEDGFGSRRVSFSGLSRLGLRFGKEGSNTLDLFAEVAFTAPLIEDPGQAGRVYRAGAELAVPLIKEKTVDVTLKGRFDWAQQYVPEADCNAPERFGAPCFFRGISVGPILVVGFGGKGYALNKAEREEKESELEKQPEPPPAPPPPKAPEKQPEPKAEERVPVLPPVVAPPPAPAPVCTGILVQENGQEVISTLGNDACGDKTEYRRKPEDVADPLAVIVCRSTGVKAIKSAQSGKTSSCADMLKKWADR
jgi:hypothetical protein